MKWYVVLAVAFCAANFVTSLALLGLSSYHLYDNDGFIPIKESEEWFAMVIGLIPYCIFVMIVSLFSCWGVIQKNRKWAACVVALNALSISGSIFFVVVFTQQATTDPISDEALLQLTKKSIENYQEKNEDSDMPWIPPWLDHIQKESTTCCGISTYKDWEELLWASPDTKSLIPTSCCISQSNDTSICPRDLARIPYPGTSAMFIKVEHGCSEEINIHIKRHILETYKFVWILTSLLVAGEFAYSLLYLLRYQYKGGKSSDIDPPTKVSGLESSDGDSETGISGVDESIAGMTKITVTQIGSSTEALQGDIRINPDTGNPVLSFNVVTYGNKYPPANESGSGSFAGIVSPLKQQSLLPLSANSPPNNDVVMGNMQANSFLEPSSFTYNKMNKMNTGSGTTEPITVQPQPRPVYLVQDTSDYIGKTMDAIASGTGSTSSFDDFGDLPSAEATRTKNNPKPKENATGIARKKHY